MYFLIGVHLPPEGQVFEFNALCIRGTSAVLGTFHINAIQVLFSDTVSFIKSDRYFIGIAHYLLGPMEFKM